MTTSVDAPVTRCAGCGFTHPVCTSQRDALEFIHRLAFSLTDPDVHRKDDLLTEYEERWA